MRLLFAALAATVTLAPATAQEHHHPAQDAKLHEQFYSTWKVPNGGHDRVSSCCNLQDCYPTTVKKVAGVWFAQRREDHAWIVIPEGIIESNQSDPRESPDGRAHVCMSPPNHSQAGRVYCAVLGSEI